MDGFIDDITTINFDYKQWIDCAKSLSLLVIHTLFWPLQSSEPLKQDDTLFLRKLAGEGEIAEHKTCLGWGIHTQSLRVFLPKQKQIACTTDIQEALSPTEIKTDILESLIGKLNHASHVILSERYLLNHLHHLLKRGGKWGPQRLQLWHWLYLQLLIKFIQYVTTKGVPINNIVFVKPPVTVWSDACKNGIGGYSDNVPSWRWRIPSESHGKTHVEPPRIPSIISDHLHNHPTNGTRVTHIGIHIQF